MSQDEDFKWLRALQEDLWPPRPPSKLTIKLEAKRPLTKAELARVEACIEEHDLVAEMICTSMFGGYGMRLYSHELFPGTGADFLLTLVEDHLPVPTRYDHIMGTVKESPKKVPGEGRTDAWKVFSKYTHDEGNRRMLRKYGLQDSRDRWAYDY